MEDQRSRLDGLIRSLLIVSALVSLCLFLFDNSPAADECEIVKAVFYERKQGEIVTDLDSGIPCRRYQVVTCPCAMLTIRDNSRLMYSKDIEVEATFADQATRAKKAWCDKKQREDDETYSCIVCFESDLPISKVICTFR
jgi:hypothetical protein